VLIQTHLPEQPVIKALAAGDRDRFLEAEAAARREAGLPPFGRLAALILSAADAEAADGAAGALARAAPHLPGVAVLGPAPAPLAVVNLQAVLREWLARVRLRGSARLQVDIDPYSFL
jgi:primosomal protein N' (replication factor Y)